MVLLNKKLKQIKSYFLNQKKQILFRRRREKDLLWLQKPSAKFQAKKSLYSIKKNGVVRNRKANFMKIVFQTILNIRIFNNSFLRTQIYLVTVKLIKPKGLRRKLNLFLCERIELHHAHMSNEAWLWVRWFSDRFRFFSLLQIKLSGSRVTEGPSPKTIVRARKWFYIHLKVISGPQASTKTALGTGSWAYQRK